MKRLLSGLLAALVIVCLFAGCTKPATNTTAPTGSTAPSSSVTEPPATTPKINYANSIVLIYTANIRGDLNVYSQLAAVRAHYEVLGSTVYLVDAGNHLQGSVYTGSDMGLTVYSLMDALGYDVAAMGVYDFAHGEATVGHADHGDLTHHYTQAELYRGTDAMTYQKNQPWSKDPIYSTRGAKAAATFQVICSNLQTEAENTGYYAFESTAVLGDTLRLGFVSTLPDDARDLIREDFLLGYSNCEIAAPDCDILVSLGGGEGDIVIDVPADGTLAAGAYVIDRTSQYIAFEEVDLSQTNASVDAWIDALPLGTVVGTSDVDLIGSVSANGNGQTNLGVLVADALKWYAENKLESIPYPVIGLFNGGNCEAFLYSGTITQLDIRNAIHGSQAGVGVVYLTGAQLLEVLEAATQREDCPGWAQVSGIDYTVDTTKAYDFGAAYGPYYKANSVNRVSITTLDFDPEATYAIVADQLLLKGADTYYLLAQQEIAAQDATDICQILALYIQEALGGRITAPTAEEKFTVTVTLDAAGGSCESPSITVLEGGRYGSLPTATRDGYVFLGWFTAAEGGVAVTKDTTVSALTLYAQWAVKTSFTVTLDANGGRISPYDSQIEKETGTTYGTLPEPSRDGYKFLGWYTQPEKGTKIKSSTKFSETQDLTLYAHWEYDALTYWTYALETTVQQIPQCRRVVVYLERNADSKTYIECDFLTDAGAINPAEGLEHYKVSDDWIQSVQPHIVIKLTTDMDMCKVYKLTMQRRLPDAEIYVFSTSAVSGSAKYQLYCRLYLAKLLYPEYFEDVDLAAVKSDLNVKATIYY